MILSKLALTLTEQDINTGLATAFAKMAEGPQGEALKKVKDPRVSLKNGTLIFKCKASMGILPVPVEAQIRLTPAQNGEALDITLAKVSLAMMGGDMIAGQLMGQLASAVAGKPGLSVVGNTLDPGRPAWHHPRRHVARHRHRGRHHRPRLRVSRRSVSETPPSLPARGRFALQCPALAKALFRRSGLKPQPPCIQKHRKGHTKAMPTSDAQVNVPMVSPSEVKGRLSAGKFSRRLYFWN